MKYAPGSKNTHYLLKLMATLKGDGMVSGFGKLQKDIKDSEILPDATNHDFTFLQYADDLYGHVLNVEEDNARNFCFADDQGCFIVLSLQLQNTKSTVNFSSTVVTSIQELQDDYTEVSHRSHGSPKLDRPCSWQGTTYSEGVRLQLLGASRHRSYV